MTPSMSPEMSPGTNSGTNPSTSPETSPGKGLRLVLKRTLQAIALVLVFPWALICGFGRLLPVYTIGAHVMALGPGAIGNFLRAANFLVFDAILERDEETGWRGGLELPGADVGHGRLPQDRRTVLHLKPGCFALRDRDLDFHGALDAGVFGGGRIVGGAGGNHDGEILRGLLREGW